MVRDRLHRHLPELLPDQLRHGQRIRTEAGTTEGWTWWEGSDTGTEPDDGTARPSCERDESGSCKSREIKPDEWERLLARIAAIREDKDYCRSAKEALSALAQWGAGSQRLRFWDGIDKLGADEQRFGQNLSDAKGRYIEFDSYWVWHMPELVAHEGLHAWLGQLAAAGMPSPVPPGTSNEKWVDGVDENCV